MASGDVLDIHHDLCGECNRKSALACPYDRDPALAQGRYRDGESGDCPRLPWSVSRRAVVLALGPLIGQMMYGRSIALRTVSKEGLCIT